MRFSRHFLIIISVFFLATSCSGGNPSGSNLSQPAAESNSVCKKLSYWIEEIENQYSQVLLPSRLFGLKEDLESAGFTVPDQNPFNDDEIATLMLVAEPCLSVNAMTRLENSLSIAFQGIDAQVVLGSNSDESVGSMPIENGDESVDCLSRVKGDESIGCLPIAKGDEGEEPSLKIPRVNPPSRLFVEDIFRGNGRVVTTSSTVTVHYVLASWTTQKIIVSSWSGDPAVFPLSGVVKGFQQGVAGMKEGGRRMLVIPPDLGYGKNGSGPIVPNETLVFVIDILSIN